MIKSANCRILATLPKKHALASFELGEECQIHLYAYLALFSKNPEFDNIVKIYGLALFPNTHMHTVGNIARKRALVPFDFGEQCQIHIYTRLALFPSRWQQCQLSDFGTLDWRCKVR